MRPKPNSFIKPKLSFDILLYSTHYSDTKQEPTENKLDASKYPMLSQILKVKEVRTEFCYTKDGIWDKYFCQEMQVFRVAITPM